MSALKELLDRNGIGWDVFWRGSDCMRHPPTVVVHEMIAMRAVLQRVHTLLDESSQHEDDGGDQELALSSLDDARAILAEVLQ